MKSRNSIIGQLVCYMAALLFFIPQLIKIINADITQNEKFLGILAISAIFIPLVVCGILIYLAQFLSMKKRSHSARNLGLGFSFLGVFLFLLGILQFQPLGLRRFEIMLATYLVSMALVAFCLLGLVMWLAMSVKKTRQIQSE